MPLASINSNVATLRVNYQPKVSIISNPKNIKVYTNIRNRPVVFSVIAKINIPNATLKYQWYHNWTNLATAHWNEIIPGATSASYTVPDSWLRYSPFYTHLDEYYVKVTATLNGKEIASTTSSTGRLSFLVYDGTN